MVACLGLICHNISLFRSSEIARTKNSHFTNWDLRWDRWYYKKDVFVQNKTVLGWSCKLQLYIVKSHRAAVVLSFLACVSHATSLGKSYGSQINRKSCFENLWSGAFWDRSPSDPKGVPWDQNFGSKNFLIWSYNDAILCVLLICYAKIWVLC